MNLTRVVLTCLLCLVVHPVMAGDAVVIGYNCYGIWTAVTYNRSSTPKGGAHYRNAAQARAAALRDLRTRGGEDLAIAHVINDSDNTAYVTVARGRTALGRDVTAVGHRKSQAEADKRAFAELNEAGATTNQKIVYRYFSYGADSELRAK
jgi:hypothetical protein